MQYYRSDQYNRERQRIMLKYLRHIQGAGVPETIRDKIQSELDRLRRNSCVSTNRN